MGAFTWPGLLFAQQQAGRICAHVRCSLANAGQPSPKLSELCMSLCEHSFRSITAGALLCGHRQAAKKIGV